VPSSSIAGASVCTHRKPRSADYFRKIPTPKDIAPTSLDADHHRLAILQRVQTAPGYLDAGPDPMLVISEVRKGDGNGSQLTIEDLMGSASTGYSADAVLLLETDQEDTAAPSVPVRLRIAKGRDGVVRTTIPLIFHHTCSRFTEAPPSTVPTKAEKAPKGRPRGNRPPVNPLGGQ
jgi:hypothetical protein